VLGTLESGKDGIIPFLDSIHLYVHPSRTEGLPRVVIEAMSRGRLALGSNVGGIPELLNKKYIHKSGDVNKLSSDIVSIYKDQKNWENIIRDNIHKSQDYLEMRLQVDREKFLIEKIEQQNERIIYSI
jgi:glycosyltransferase involved in cell wall biosynthesis